MPAQATGQDRTSTVYVYIPVSAGPGINLVGDDCIIAMIPTGSRPVSGDWVAAEIIDGNIVRVLVGDYQNPDGITPIGEFASYPTYLDVWVDITDLPERPVAPVGTWTVT